MRKTTTEAVSAFMNGSSYKSSNTKVVTENNQSKLLLYGHLIAEKDEKGIRITAAGYLTNTTKERLNGIPGVWINQEKGKWYLNGVYWNGEWTTI